MRTFENTWFARFAKKEGITGDELRNVVNQLEGGEWDADLGGHVYKQRIPREGEGKSGGYRVIVYFRNNDRTFFVYGFPKSRRGNIKVKELRTHKETARLLLTLSDAQLDALLKTGEYREVEG